MNILVTGGAGYIGSVTAEALLARGHEVVVLDNLSSGHRDAVPYQAAFVLADVADTAMLAYTLEHYAIEAVLHFAAHSLVGESMQQPFRYFGNNSAATMTLLETMLEHGVKKFVLSSTAALFGNPETLPIPEDAPWQPSSVYGTSKQIIEMMLPWLQQRYGLGYVSLRYFNAAGASENYGEDHRPESHLIPLVLQVAQGKRDSIGIFGNDYPTADGSCVRDYVHVCDLAHAHVLALEALQAGQAQAYNLGNGQGFSVKEVIEVCREVTGVDIASELLPPRPGDPAVLVADSSRIRQALGWQPQYPDLTSIVASAWAWHQRFPAGYEN